MASSIPSSITMSTATTTNNLPLSLSSSSTSTSLSLNNNLLTSHEHDQEDVEEESSATEFLLHGTTITAKKFGKIKNAQYHHHHHQHQLLKDQSTPINSKSFSFSTSHFDPTANATTAYPHNHNSVSDGARKERRQRKSSVTAALRSSRKSSENSNSYFNSRKNSRSSSDGEIGAGGCENANAHQDRARVEECKDDDKDKSSSYHLKWDDHVNSTVSAIQLLLHNETFVDVTLICDPEEPQEEKDDEEGDLRSKGCKDREHNNNDVFKYSDDEEDDNEVDEDFRKSVKPSNMHNNNKKSKNKNKATRKFAKEDEAEAEDSNNNNCTTTTGNSSSNHMKFKAHKVILSTCSDYFSRIFSENPCKHPVIVLKDFQPWEVRALLDFMYKGQVIVRPERLETLVKAAESLQIRGLKETVEKSPEWKKQKKVTSSSSSALTNNNSSNDEDNNCAKNKNYGDNFGARDEMMEIDEIPSSPEGESSTSKCISRSSKLNSTNPSKQPRKCYKLRNHQMRNILSYKDDDEDEDNEEGEENNEEDEENGPSSPKLLNLSMSSGSADGRHLDSLENNHSQQQILRSTLNNHSRRAAATGSRHQRHHHQNHPNEMMMNSSSLINEPQTTADEASASTAGEYQHIHNHHGQTNVSAGSPPFPRRKQARPRRRSGDFVAQDLRTTTMMSPYHSSYQHAPGPSPLDDIIALQQQHQLQEQQNNNNNEVLDFTIGNHNNNSMTKRNIANERLMPGSSQVNNFIANHFRKTWSSSTSGGSRISDSPSVSTVQSPQSHLISSSPLKRELDHEDNLLSSPGANYRSPPGTPDTSSPPIAEAPKPLRRNRRDRRIGNRHHRLSRHSAEQRRNFNDVMGNQSLLAFNHNNIPSPPANYFLNLNNGHPPTMHHPHQIPHHLSGHHSDPENLMSNNNSLGISSPSTPPKSFSPITFPLSLSSATASAAGGGAHHHHHGQGDLGGSPGPHWPGLPLGPPPIFGRHRAQHSAPRGGPPRAWSNADLTEALHNVWNKKMTTSQASRIFGIPYNSLLMYVRGKYGKSLKLDLLKKGLDLAMLEKAKNSGGGGNNSSSGTSTGNRSSTPSSNHNNNNNNNTPSHKSKSHSGDSPPLSIHINSLMGGDREQQREHNSHSATLPTNNNNNNRNDPQDIIPSGFNPFTIFGDYPPPFPFSNAAAAAAALSHILPPQQVPALNHHLHHSGGPLIGESGNETEKEQIRNSNNSGRHHHNRNRNTSDK